MAVDLARWDEEAKPSKFGDQKELKDLPDGEYEFEIGPTSKRDTKDKDGNEMVVYGAPLTVRGGPLDGEKIKFAWFVKDKDGYNRFLFDLTTLGFDADSWVVANDRPKSVMVPKALLILKGMILKGKKAKNASGYHNLDIQGRGDDGKPVKVSNEYLDEQSADPW